MAGTHAEERKRARKTIIRKRNGRASYHNIGITAVLKIIIIPAKPGLRPLDIVGA